MSEQQGALIQRPTETAFAAAASLAPVLFLTQLKANFSLDNLHIGLLQLVLLFVFRAIALASPASLFSSPSKSLPAAQNASGPKKGKGRPKGVLIDEIIAKFLTISHPDLVEKLDLETPGIKLKDGTGKELKKIKLADWKTLSDGENTKVLEHPSINRLYAISTRFPDTDIKKIWDVLIAVDRRPKWDGLCDKAEQLDEYLETHGRRASVAYMTMKGMFPVKASDLVLLSTIFRLPPTASSLPGMDPNKKVTQLVAATASVTHPERQEGKGGYQRLNLFTSGFIVEEDPKGGCRCTQITDLSGLPAWVPNSILQTVTKTLIPQSINRVGKVARTFDADSIPEHPSPRGMAEVKESASSGKPLTGEKPKGQEWMPPLLGSWRPKDGKKEDYEEGGIAGDSSGGDGDGEGEGGLEVEAPQTYAEIIGRLKKVTAQLSILEGKAKKKGGAGGGGIQSALGVDAATLGAAGGALGLATATALVARWWTGRRRI